MPGQWHIKQSRTQNFRYPSSICTTSSFVVERFRIRMECFDHISSRDVPTLLTLCNAVVSENFFFVFHFAFQLHCVCRVKMATLHTSRVAVSRCCCYSCYVVVSRRLSFTNYRSTKDERTRQFCKFLIEVGTTINVLACFHATTYCVPKEVMYAETVRHEA